MFTKIPDNVLHSDWLTVLTAVEQQLTQCIWPGIYCYELLFHDTPDKYHIGGAARHLFGADVKELSWLRRQGHSGNAHVYPDDLALWLQFLKINNAGFMGTETVQQQQTIYLRQLTLDGRQLQVMHQRRPLFLKNRPEAVALLAVTVDISHLRPANAVACISSLDMTDWTRPVFAIQRAEHTVRDQLTCRELTILELLADGKTSKQAAYLLNISPNTIDTHRRRILVKTKTGSITEAVAKALLYGWFDTAKQFATSKV